MLRAQLDFPHTSETSPADSQAAFPFAWNFVLSNAVSFIFLGDEQYQTNLQLIQDNGTLGEPGAGKGTTKEIQRLLSISLRILLEPMCFGEHVLRKHHHKIKLNYLRINLIEWAVRIHSKYTYLTNSGDHMICLNMRNHLNTWLVDSWQALYLTFH